jgi:hypothetical protein
MTRPGFLALVRIASACGAVGTAGLAALGEGPWREPLICAAVFALTYLPRALVLAMGGRLPAVGLLALLLVPGLAAAQSRLPPAPADEGSPVPRATSPLPCLGCPTARPLCREVASCADALHLLRRCGFAGLDADRDGVPCERELCGPGPLAALPLPPARPACPVS